jgi:hypothetical protein
MEFGLGVANTTDISPFHADVSHDLVTQFITLFNTTTSEMTLNDYLVFTTMLMFLGVVITSFCLCAMKSCVKKRKTLEFTDLGEVSDDLEAGKGKEKKKHKSSKKEKEKDDKKKSKKDKDKAHKRKEKSSKRDGKERFSGRDLRRVMEDVQGQQEIGFNIQKYANPQEGSSSEGVTIGDIRKMVRTRSATNPNPSVSSTLQESSVTSSKHDESLKREVTNSLLTGKKMTWHRADNEPKEIVLSMQNHTLTWKANKIIAMNTYTMKVADIVTFSPGKQTNAFKTKAAMSVPDEVCFSLTDESGQMLELQCENATIKDILFRGLVLLSQDLEKDINTHLSLGVLDRVGEGHENV